MNKVLSQKYVVSSSLVEYFIYNSKDQMLEVKYKRGKHRIYKEFTEESLEEVLNAKSLGKTLLSKTKRLPREDVKKSFFSKVFGR